MDLGDKLWALAAYVAGVIWLYVFIVRSFT